LYAAQLAKEATSWGYLFGGDAEELFGLDPLVQKWDLGSDPLQWAKGRASLLRKLWVALLQADPNPGQRPAELTERLSFLLEEHERLGEVARTYVGGRYLSRDHVGDEGGKPASRPVEKQKQLEALAFLSAAVLAEDALPITGEWAQRMGTDYQNLGIRGAVNQDRLPLWRRRLEHRMKLLSDLLSPFHLRKMVDGEQAFGKDQVLTVGEMLHKLTESIFSECQQGSPSSLSPLRREMQLRYVDGIGRMLLQKNPGNKYVRAQTRQELLDVQQNCAALRNKKSLDPDLRAHVTELYETTSALLRSSMRVHTDAE